MKNEKIENNKGNLAEFLYQGIHGRGGYAWGVGVCCVTGTEYPLLFPVISFTGYSDSLVISDLAISPTLSLVIIGGKHYM